MQNITESRGILQFPGSDGKKNQMDLSKRKYKMLLLLAYIMTEKAVITRKACVLQPKFK